MKNYEAEWWYMTIYSFDEDRPIHGPFPSEKECWDTMLKEAKNELRIDEEENGWDCNFVTVQECGRITLTNHFDDHNDVTDWYTIEIPVCRDRNDKESIT